MNIHWHNGEFIDGDCALIPSDDCGMSNGIGIFDSMMINHGIPVHIEDHHARLIHDAEIVIGKTPIFSLDDFQEALTMLLIRSPLKSDYARARTTITGGLVPKPLDKATEFNIFITLGTAPNPDDMKPVTCAIVTNFPRMAGCILENCKRLDYSRSYAARRKAEELGAEEAILTNTDGNIACGATSNIFIEENGQLFTPPLSDGVLAGVTRKNLMKEREVKEESISVDRLKAADTIYLTNSFIELREVILT